MQHSAAVRKCADLGVLAKIDDFVSAGQCPRETSVSGGVFFGLVSAVWSVGRDFWPIRLFW